MDFLCLQALHALLTALILSYVLRYVLYKERNMLYTEANHARRKGYMFPQPDRQKKVKKSMAAIKVVLGERKRIKIKDANIKADAASNNKLEEQLGSS